MKFILALGSIIAVFAFATAAHSQNRMQYLSYICSSNINFVASSQDVNQAQIDKAIQHFIMATGSRNSISLQMRSQEQVQQNQLTVEISLVNSARGAAEFINAEVANLVRSIDPSALTDVSLDVRFKNCHALAGSHL